MSLSRREERISYGVIIGLAPLGTHSRNVRLFFLNRGFDLESGHIVLLQKSPPPIFPPLISVGGFRFGFESLDLNKS